MDPAYVVALAIAENVDRALEALRLAMARRDALRESVATHADVRAFLEQAELDVDRLTRELLAALDAQDAARR